MEPLSKKPPPAHARPMTLDEQTQRWLAGESVHRIGTCDIVDAAGNVVETRSIDECTPDFSCCKPALLADEVTRKAFVEASESERMKFLGTFLGAAFALANEEREAEGKEPIRAHIAGRGPES